MRALLVAALLASSAMAAPAPFCPVGALAGGAREFGRLLQFLAVDKRALETETLRAIAQSEVPFNPMDHDGSLSATVALSFKKGFAKQLAEGMTREEWTGVRDLAQSLLNYRGAKSERTDTIREETKPGVWRTVRVPEMPVAQLTFSELLSPIPTLSSISLADGRLAIKMKPKGPRGSDEPWQFFYLDGRTGEASSPAKLLDLGPHPYISVDLGFVKGANGQVLSLSMVNGPNRHGSQKEPLIHVHDVATGAEVGRYPSHELKTKSQETVAAIPYRRTDGSFAVVHPWPNLQNLTPEAKPAFPYYWENAQYLRGGATSDRAYAAVLRKGPFRLFNRRLELAVTDFATGKEVLRAPLDISASDLPKRWESIEANKEYWFYRPPVMAVQDKGDGSFFAAVRHRDNVYITDSATKKTITVAAPMQGAWGQHPFAGFVKTSGGWVLVTELMPPSVSAINVETGNTKTIKVQNLKYSNVKLTVGGNNETYLFADTVDTNGKELVTTVAFNGDWTLTNPRPVQKALPLSTFTNPDGRVFRAYVKDGTIVYEQML